MREEFHSFNAADFRQRYRGSYGWFTVEATKKRVLVWMQEVNERQVTFTDEDGIGYTAVADTGVEFEFMPIKKRLFVLNDTLYFIRRKPARMWARGVNTQNTQVSVVGGGNNHLGFNHVAAAFVTEPMDVLQTCNLLEQKQARCVALSEMFGVVNTSLYVYDELIGSFMPDTKEIKLDDDMFRQEILDLVTRIGLPYKVLHG